MQGIIFIKFKFHKSLQEFSFMIMSKCYFSLSSQSFDL